MPTPERWIKARNEKNAIVHNTFPNQDRLLSDADPKCKDLADTREMVCGQASAYDVGSSMLRKPTYADLDPCLIGILG